MRGECNIDSEVIVSSPIPLFTFNPQRRFRSLKVWFVIRSFGVAGLQEYIRNVSNKSYSGCTILVLLHYSAHNHPKKEMAHPFDISSRQ